VHALIAPKSRQAYRCAQLPGFLSAALAQPQSPVRNTLAPSGIRLRLLQRDCAGGVMDFDLRLRKRARESDFTPEG